MTHVDLEKHFAWNDIAAVRTVLDKADSGDGLRSKVTSQDVYRIDQARGAEKSILPQVHRRSTSVRFLTQQGHVVPAHSLHASHDTDRVAQLFENGPLLDVQFEHGGKPMRTRFLRTAVADVSKLITEFLAVTVFAR